MKTIRFFVLLAAVLTFAACDKDKDDLRHERDIVYTVAEETTTVHLTTEAEWDALLDQFCNYAEGGSSVTFRNAKSANKSATKEAVTYSTTSREEMKRWMAQMEDEGKTVTVTYDPATGTWNGTAYATAQQPQQDDCYTGVLVSVGNPALDSIVPPGIVAALRISDDSTLIIAMDGQWFWNGLVLDGVTYSDGDTVTLCGTVLTAQDYYGNEFLVLELGEAISPVPLPNSYDTSAVSLVMQFKVDYLSHQLEGYHIDTIRGYRNSSSAIPFRMQYCAPGDFGSVKLFYGPTGDTLFSGGIVWMGCGSIEHPAAYNTDFTVMYNMPPYPGQEAFYMVGGPVSTFADLCHYFENDISTDSLCLWLWEAVSSSNVYQDWTVPAYQMQMPRFGIYFYQPSVGVGNPVDWDYILFLERQL